MRSNTKKLLGAVAVAGLVAASGSAFTASGLASTADAAAEVGGTVTQSVDGATLTDVQYTADGDGKVSNVRVTFGAALKTGSAASIKIDGAASLTCAVTATTTVYNCAVATPVTVASLAVTVTGADQA